LFLHPADLRAQVAFEGLVGAEEEVLVALDTVRPTFEHVTNRRIGREAQAITGPKKSNVVGATHRLWLVRAVPARRPHGDL